MSISLFIYPATSYRLLVWLMDWLIIRSFGWLIHRLISGLVDLWIKWSTGWLIDVTSADFQSFKPLISCVSPSLSFAYLTADAWSDCPSLRFFWCLTGPSLTPFFWCLAGLSLTSFLLMPDRTVPHFVSSDAWPDRPSLRFFWCLTGLSLTSFLLMPDRTVPHFVFWAWICTFAIFSFVDHFVNKAY